MVADEGKGRLGKLGSHPSKAKGVDCREDSVDEVSVQDHKGRNGASG